MKLVIVAMTVLFSVGNVLAQPYPVSLPETETEADEIGQMPIEECRTNLRQCLDNIGNAGENNTERLAQLAERMGFASADDMLASDCRSRRGTWNGSECLCSSPNSWYTTDQECCVENTRAYERRQNSCLDSGGSYSCRGGCRCPMGTQLLDSECVGEAATREEVDRLRARIPELENELGRIHGELDTARAQGDDQADQIEELENLLAAAQRALDDLRDLLAVRERQLTEAIGRPPAVPTPGEIPGETEARVEVARGDTEQNPLAPAPPPEEGEEKPHFCNASFGGVLLCYILPAAALAGLTTGIVCAAGHCENPDGVIRYGYH